MYVDHTDFSNFNPTMLFCIKGFRNTKDIPHKHNHMEMAYIMSNKAIFYIDGIKYDVKEGDFVFINPNKEHSGLVVNPDSPSEEFFVGFSNFDLGDMPNNTMFKDSPIISTNAKSRRNITYLIEQMLKENELEKIGKHAMLRSYLTQLILLAIREYKNQDDKDYDNEPKVSDKITEYFHNHLSEKISLEQIAKNMYLSPFYISKIFKEEVGEAPINYLIRIRLELARELLLNGNLSIREISSNVGYDDAYHFSKIFKKYYGVSPAEYKKLHT